MDWQLIGHRHSFCFSDWSCVSPWIRVSKPLHLCIIERPWLSLCWHPLSKISERERERGPSSSANTGADGYQWMQWFFSNGFSFSFVASRLPEWNDEMIVCCKCLDGGSSGYTQSLDRSTDSPAPGEPGVQMRKLPPPTPFQSLASH